ncbi:muramoyltetrapeptide carboxypeptidase [Hymenobacter luteus]|uniref:Muramoyltetrapeptide carboxypeptidase n=2 Tax=Hymenobacter TaxID=89966 RepID=A0A7W9SXQ9_9BACT|nr:MULTISPECIES: LD-carboxypeptidase [Hymenobacter]MBB4599870.1 muramoyltetrapeptide carboxypeptidase [Hymenobacter latericoloratus]MBB6057820.1 muramoyltetrapeptide carboxypeptidase [Hymenobacter luteus]
MPTTAPAPLRPGDQVAIVCPARKASHEELAAAVATLESWGLRVVLGASTNIAHHQFGGDDEVRRQDFQQQLDNPDIRAILCARGGYGTPRIIDGLDFSRFAQDPKWIVGFSDITTLHCHLLKLGHQSIHGVMPLLFHQEGGEESVESLRKALFGEELRYTLSAHPLNQLGTAIGELVGGNLSLLQTLTGTASDVSTAGRILFLEDIDEYLYAIDRMMLHLDRTGKLRHLAGLLVGHFTNPQDNAVPYGQTPNEIIQHYAGKYGFPVAHGFPIGHEPQNIALIVGRQARLTVDEAGARLEYL